MTPESVIKIDIRARYMQQLAALLVDKSQEPRQYPTENSLVTIRDAVECSASVLDHLFDLVQRYQEADHERAMYAVMAAPRTDGGSK